jgi:hypothetical protein
MIRRGRREIQFLKHALPLDTHKMLITVSWRLTNHTSLQYNRDIGFVKMKGYQYGYSDTNNILYVVYGNRRSPAGHLDHNLYVGTRFCVSYTKHVVSHSARNL